MNCLGKCSDCNAVFELYLVPEQNSLINLLFQNLQERGYIKLVSAFTFHYIRTYMSIIPTRVILRAMCEFDSNPIRRALFK